MRKIQYEAIITGFLIGALIGALAGFGELQWIKKSQREIMLLPLISISAVVGSIAGISIFLKTEKKRYVDKRLGISDAANELYKNGRFWIASTKWFDNTSGKNNELFTGRDKDGNLVSEMNGLTILDHKIRSGSKANVTKYHEQVKQTVFKTLREQFSEH